MAWLECPETGYKFRIMTETGTTYGTNTKYIENCPFCGARMSDEDVVEKE